MLTLTYGDDNDTLRHLGIFAYLLKLILVADLEPTSFTQIRPATNRNVFNVGGPKKLLQFLSPVFVLVVIILDCHDYL